MNEFSPNMDANRGNWWLQQKRRATDRKFLQTLQRFHEGITTAVDRGSFAEGPSHQSLTNREREVLDCIAWIEFIRRASTHDDLKRRFDWQCAADSGPPRVLQTDRFAIRRQIGRGAMGVVYEAFDCQRNELVAVKELTRHDPLGIYCFKREFRLIAGIDHPNLVRLHELLFADERWLLVMELLVGRGVLHFLCGPNESVPLSTDNQFARCRSVLGQLAMGLGKLHASGRVHRDLKPANIFVADPERVVILDMGLVGDSTQQLTARTVQYFGRERQTVFVGSPRYMSPEQARGEPACPLSDWFSIGVLLYEVLTGCLMTRTRTGDRIEISGTPSLINPAVPRDLDTLCVGLLQESRDRRFGTDDVLAILQGRERVRPQQIIEASDSSVNRTQAVVLDWGAIEAERYRPCILQVYRSGEGDGNNEVSDFANRCRVRRSTLVLTGRCVSGDGSRYSALDSVVESVLDYLSRTESDELTRLSERHLRILLDQFPVLAIAKPEVVAMKRIQGFEPATESEKAAAISELLRAITKSFTVVVVIHDLQNSDQDGAALLGEVLSNKRILRMCAVLTVQSDGVHVAESVRTFDEVLSRHGRKTITISE